MKLNEEEQRERNDISHTDLIEEDVEKDGQEIKYIIVYPVFISSEVYYFSTLEEVKQNIMYMSTTQKEVDETRIFKITREIDVKDLEINIEEG